jgi:NADPH:quinone reductase-like Zn-dependent oxidoreductase
LESALCSALPDTVWNRAIHSVRIRTRLIRVRATAVSLAGLPEMFSTPWHTMMNGKKVIARAAVEHNECLHQLAELAGSGKFLSVIDRSCTFDQMVAAHRYVDKRPQKSNTVIKLWASDE